MQFITFISNIAIPFIILIIVLYGLIERKKVFDTFLDGAKILSFKKVARINWAWIPKKRSQILQIEQIHIGTNPLNRLNPREILIDEEYSRRFYRLSRLKLV